MVVIKVESVNVIVVVVVKSFVKKKEGNKGNFILKWFIVSNNYYNLFFVLNKDIKFHTLE